MATTAKYTALCIGPVNANVAHIRQCVGADRALLIDRTESDSFMALEFNVPIVDEPTAAAYSALVREALDDMGVIAVEVSDMSLEEFYTGVRLNYLEGGKPAEEFPCTGRSWEVIGVRGHQRNGVDGFRMVEDYPPVDDLPF